ncbi:hypothetical protein [Nitrosomonas sp.]
MGKKQSRLESQYLQAIKQALAIVSRNIKNTDKFSKNL